MLVVVAVAGSAVFMHYVKDTLIQVVCIVALAGLWFWSHVLKERKMDQLYAELMKLDHEKRTEVIADLSPEDRDDVLKRRARDLRPNKSPETTRGK